MKKRKTGARSVKIAEAFELPPDLLLGIPKIVVLGDREATVENYKGIVEYDGGKVVLNTSVGIFSIVGENLDIKTVTDDDITFEGRVTGFEIT